LEQLGPCAVFLGYQLLQYCEIQRKKHKLSFKQAWLLRIKVFGVAALALASLAAFLRYKGYFGPISARVRGLFVKHTKTGNPLVDSVAELQPAQASAYNQYLGSGVVTIIPLGFVLVALRYFHDASSFLLVYGVATYFFSLKMVRLILLTAPIASVFTGLFIGRVIGVLLYNVLGFMPSIFHALALDEDEERTNENTHETVQKKNKKGKKVETKIEDSEANGTLSLALLKSAIIRAAFAYLFYFSFMTMFPEAKEFYTASHSIAKHLANPTIVQKGTLKSGETVVVDDYREW
jgi:dolichyl-diphosphooligosaccharide--protein glycosyltransferase